MIRYQEITVLQVYIDILIKLIAVRSFIVFYLLLCVSQNKCLNLEHHNYAYIRRKQMRFYALHASIFLLHTLCC